MINTQFGMVALPGKKSERGREGGGNKWGRLWSVGRYRDASLLVEFCFLLGRENALDSFHTFMASSREVLCVLFIPYETKAVQPWSGQFGLRLWTPWWGFCVLGLSGRKVVMSQIPVYSSPRSWGHGLWSHRVWGLVPELSFWALNSWLLTKLICTVGIARVRKNHCWGQGLVNIATAKNQQVLRSPAFLETH